MKNNQGYTGMEIAIIGLACRVPGADNWREYWNNLKTSVESIEFLSDDALTSLKADKKLIRQSNFINARAVLKNKEQFDAAFFDYKPIEANLMNPMHRIFHECVWEALEDASCNLKKIKGAVGLFAGGGNDLNWKAYAQLSNQNTEIDELSLDYLSGKDYLTSLLSYKLNLNGPVFSVNTACSTSLVAINLACNSLLLGEAKIAIAGGISIGTSKNTGYLYEEGMVKSSDGHCRAFDQAASGCVGGEGVGIVVLKRLSEALKDNDHIYAIIKGSAVNNDGNNKVGYTAPGVEGQVKCIKNAQKFAGILPESISYIEAHGTGTRLGDPIEVEALNIAFNRDRTHRCAIGS
ncbi:beta-ketoacyl synthase N-terminal-like domain-containing protein, partial [Mucilaginibacter angelicae]